METFIDENGDEYVTLKELEKNYYKKIEDNLSTQGYKKHWAYFYENY